MSVITYTAISSRSVVAVFDRERYKVLTDCGIGKWSKKHSGYLLTSKKALDEFKAFVLESTTPPTLSKRFRRARSIGDAPSDAVSPPDKTNTTGIIDHYKQYKKIPEVFNKTMFEHSEIDLSSSDDDSLYDSDSSEDYPKPSPGRSMVMGDGTYDKLSTLRKRFDLLG